MISDGLSDTPSRARTSASRSGWERGISAHCWTLRPPTVVRLSVALPPVNILCLVEGVIKKYFKIRLVQGLFILWEKVINKIIFSN